MAISRLNMGHDRDLARDVFSVSVKRTWCLIEKTIDKQDLQRQLGVEMRPWRSTNEDASSAGNMEMNEPNLKKKRSDSNNCHQCHRNDKGRVVRCTRCNKKGHCITCITKCY
ncbi:hypothetical protein ACP275_02G103400 [Erythranthe tilingii]